MIPRSTLKCVSMPKMGVNPSSCISFPACSWEDDAGRIAFAVCGGGSGADGDDIAGHSTRYSRCLPPRTCPGAEAGADAASVGASTLWTPSQQLRTGSWREPAPRRLGGRGGHRYSLGHCTVSPLRAVCIAASKPTSWPSACQRLHSRGLQQVGLVWLCSRSTTRALRTACTRVRGPGVETDVRPSERLPCVALVWLSRWSAAHVCRSPGSRTGLSHSKALPVCPTGRQQPETEGKRAQCGFERGWAEWEGGREMHGVRESWDQQPPAVLQQTCACNPPTSQPGSSLHFCRGTCRVVYKDGVVWARRHASTAKMCAASEARRH